MYLGHLMFTEKKKVKCLKLLIKINILQVAMRALGFDVKKADVLKIMKDYDREASGKIAFDDFNEVSKYLYL